MIPNMNEPDRIERITNLLKRANERLKNSMETTFVCVLLPEFLPLEETERLVEFLTDNNIETHTMVVNQVIPKEKISNCLFCNKRYSYQREKLETIHEVYEDFNIVEVPLFDDEIKGLEGIQHYSKFLTNVFSH